MKQNSNLYHFHSFCFILFPRLLTNIIFFCLTKTGANTAPRVPKLGDFDGRVPKARSQVTLATCLGGRLGLSYMYAYFFIKA